MKTLIENFISTENNILDNAVFWKNEPAEFFSKVEKLNAGRLPLFTATKSSYIPAHGGSMRKDTMEEFSEDATVVGDVAFKLATYPDTQKLKLCTLYEKKGENLFDLLAGLENFYAVEEAAYYNTITSNNRLFSFIDVVDFQKLAACMYDVVVQKGADNVLALVGSNRWSDRLVESDNVTYLLGTPYFQHKTKNTYLITSGINRFVRFSMSKKEGVYSIFVKSLIAAGCKNVHYFSHR